MKQQYDAIVIGAGLGGLLAAATIVKQGGSVLVLEKLRYIGGRFTTVDQDGYAMTTGALHMAPHGGGGPLARAMRELGLAFDIVPRDVMASFYLRGQHVLWNKPLDVMRLFNWRGRLDLLKVTAHLSSPFATARAEQQPFAAWLAEQTTEQDLQLFFESFVQFAASVRCQDVTFGEMRAIHQNVLRYGMPGTPVGGCGAIVQRLAAFVSDHGGVIRTGVEVLRILGADRVTGVRVLDRRSQALHTASAPLVVSDAGPEVTRALMPSLPTPAERPPKAAGMKLHIVSDKSMIPHNGVMLCLGTRRVSGMVEVSRAVRGVAPPGMHMIDTFQVMRTDSMVEERDLAIADLRDIFGADEYDQHCRILRTSAFRERWPVNHARQGHDLRDQEPVPGLVMVGDAFKPSGHIMVEGVAHGVRRIAPRLRAVA